MNICIYIYISIYLNLSLSLSISLSLCIYIHTGGLQGAAAAAGGSAATLLAACGSQKSECAEGTAKTMIIFKTSRGGIGQHPYIYIYIYIYIHTCIYVYMHIHIFSNFVSDVLFLWLLISLVLCQTAGTKEMSNFGTEVYH